MRDSLRIDGIAAALSRLAFVGALLCDEVIVQSN